MKLIVSSLEPTEVSHYGFELSGRELASKSRRHDARHCLEAHGERRRRIEDPGTDLIRAESAADSVEGRTESHALPADLMAVHAQRLQDLHGIFTRDGGAGGSARRRTGARTLRRRDHIGLNIGTGDRDLSPVRLEIRD
jgi:hypothetical protein